MNLSARHTLDRTNVLPSNHHVLLLVFASRLKLIEAIQFLAWTKLLLLSLILHHVFGQVLSDLHMFCLQLLEIEIFQALVLRKLSATELFPTNLTHDPYLWTFSFDVLSQFSTSQKLILLHVADVAAEFRALIHLHMLLKLIDCFPADGGVRATLLASMWELTKFNNVTDDGVDLHEEISLCLTVRATHRTLLVNQLIVRLVALAAQARLPRLLAALVLSVHAVILKGKVALVFHLQLAL